MPKFQFGTLEGEILVGGEVSVALSQVDETKSHSPDHMARGAAAAVPLIVIVPFAILATGGPAPMEP